MVKLFDLTLLLLYLRIIVYVTTKENGEEIKISEVERLLLALNIELILFLATILEIIEGDKKEKIFNAIIIVMVLLSGKEVIKYLAIMMLIEYVALVLFYTIQDKFFNIKFHSF